MNSIQNGKGSKPRPYNVKEYRKNYNDIEWHHGENIKVSCGPFLDPIEPQVLSDILEDKSNDKPGIVFIKKYKN